MKLRYFIYWILIVVPIYLMFKTVVPSTPFLSEKVKVCSLENSLTWRIEKTADIINMFCDTHISLDTLYKAQTLTVIFKTDQQFDLKVQFMGKKDFLLSLDPATVIPEAVGTSSLMIKLDNNPSPKFNRLVRDIDTINFIFYKFDKTKQFNTQIIDLYLQ